MLFVFLQVVFDRLKGMALVLYNEIEYAQAAVKETKGRKIGGNKIKVCRMTLSRTKTKSCLDPNLLMIGILLAYSTSSIYPQFSRAILQFFNLAT